MLDDTLSLSEAARFCGVSKRQMALDGKRLGLGTKKTKEWRFIRGKLLTYLDPAYASQRRALSSTQEESQCLSSEKAAGFGGSLLTEYESLLGLRTTRQQKP